jgi:adenosylhomocysteine nucleosidase
MITVLISAKAEWNVVKEHLPGMLVRQSPFGEWGHPEGINQTTTEQVVFFHGGWGKIKAAASTQFVVDDFAPSLVVNIGTCGGFAGEVDVGQVLLVEKTIVYDIHERMFDPDKAIDAYSTTLDLDWVKDHPPNVRRCSLVSGDRDLDPASIRTLKHKYGAIAGDWESGAIAHICHLNNVPCLILRGVSDLISEKQGEAYDKPEVFLSRTRQIMPALIDSLPMWIEKFEREKSHKKMDAGSGQ